MRTTTTLIIGAGQCGLAASFELSRRSIDHLVIDAGRAGESWQSRRWDSLRLLTPNWMNVLAGDSVCSDPEGFVSARGFAARFKNFTTRNATPIIEGLSVSRLSRFADGYMAETNNGPIRCRSVIVATGACAIPKIPAFAAGLPTHIKQISPIAYRNPAQLSDGRVLVVGSSASGLQIARELAMSGRAVTMAVGNHSRLPRSYRGTDILTWMHLVRAFDEPFTKVDDVERVRRTPSLPIIGSTERHQLDLNSLQQMGVEITGRMADIRDGAALFSGSLANVCASADLKMNRLLDRVDEWVTTNGLDALVEAPERLNSTSVPSHPNLMISLSDFKTVVWATGFTPDHRFIDIPVFDHKGRIKHHGGLVEPGLAVMGLPHLRTARSVHVDGAWRDAKAITRRIIHDMDQPLAA